MMIGKVNRVSVPVYQPQIPHGLSGIQAGSLEVKNLRLTRYGWALVLNAMT
jgi:hypothetical protein